MKKILLALCSAHILVTMLDGQTVSGREPVDTIRTWTEVVEVPVVVTDKHGHAAALDKSKFHVFDRGEERPVASIEEVVGDYAVDSGARTLSGEEFSNVPDVPKPSNSTVVLFDTLNTSTEGTDSLMHEGYLRNARSEIIRYSHSHPLTTPLMIAILGPAGLRVVHGFGDPRSEIPHDLEKLPFAAPFLPDQNPTLDLRRSVDDGIAERFAALSGIGGPAKQLTKTAECLTQLADALAAIPGRKSVIWITGGLPDVSRRPYLMWVDEGLQKARQALSSANVSVYPISITPTIDNPVWTSPEEQTSSVPEHSSLKNPLGPIGASQELLAFSETTGGQACTFSSRLEKCLNRAFSDGESYYLLTYYVTHDAKPGWHSLKVTVDAPGVRVRARRGYSSALPQQDLPIEQINTVLASPLDATAIPLKARFTTYSRPGPMPGGAASKDEHRPDITSSVQVDLKILRQAVAVTRDDGSNPHIRFDVVLLILDSSTGERVQTVAQTVNIDPRQGSLNRILTDGIDYRRRFSLHAGHYIARGIVRDFYSGKIGSITFPLRVGVESAP